ncbi:Low temperature-induced protein lt101.2 [Carex littledalei]|uniref:Low temperature-induced protein lt101.2 n=1 Tax=Carex littledalei TaxID=544730 RepID=A0A833R9Y1_9POAL|nr:Low temperature-induced protein lt101.2 [Carex littledalei]
MGAATLVEILLAIILPPVGVFLRYGCALITWNVPVGSDKDVCVCVFICKTDKDVFMQIHPSQTLNVAADILC